MIPSPIKTRKATRLGKLLRVAGYRRGTITRKVQGMVVPVCASSKAAVAIYEIGLPTVEGLEKKVNRYIRSWLGRPPGMSSVALYSKSAKLRLPLRSIVEEYKVSKIRTQSMLNNSADIRIREVKPLLRTKRKFEAQDEINKSVSELTFEEMRSPIQTGRHAVGWNHFAKWSESCSAIRAELIIRERRREMERERVTKAVQQSQQGR